MRKTLGEVLRERRLRRGDTQESTAFAIGCDIGTIGRWERHRMCVTTHREGLRAYLGIDHGIFEELLVRQAEVVARRRERPCPGSHPQAEPVAVLDHDGLARHGWTTEAITRELLAIDFEVVPDLSWSEIGSLSAWTEVLAAYSDWWRVLAAEPDRILGYWMMVPLREETFEALADGRIREADLGLDRLEPLPVAGVYPAHLVGFSLRAAARGDENRARLFDSLVERVEAFARAGLFFDRVTAVARTAEGERLCRIMGAEPLGTPRPAGEGCRPATGFPLYCLRLIPFPVTGRLARRRELATRYRWATDTVAERPPTPGDIERAETLRRMWNAREMLLARRLVCRRAKAGSVGPGGAQSEILAFFDQLHHFLLRGEISREYLRLAYGGYLELYGRLLEEAVREYRARFGASGRHAGIMALTRELGSSRCGPGTRTSDDARRRLLFEEELERVELFLA